MVAAFYSQRSVTNFGIFATKNIFDFPIKLILFFGKK